RVPNVALRFVGAALHGVLGLVDELAAAIDPLARVLGGAAVAFRRGIGEVVRLLRDLAAEFRPRFGGEQHAEARAENSAGEQTHHEAAAAPALAVETIVSVCHFAPPNGFETPDSRFHLSNLGSRSRFSLPNAGCPRARRGGRARSR